MLAYRSVVEKIILLKFANLFYIYLLISELALILSHHFPFLVRLQNAIRLVKVRLPRNGGREEKILSPPNPKYQSFCYL